MGKFKKILTEGEKRITIASVKKVLKNLDLDILNPNYFHVERHTPLKGTVFEGKPYIEVEFSTPRAKDLPDIEKTVDALKKAFGPDKVVYADGASFVRVFPKGHYYN
jgi:hypothetical protein